jgi:hypothetical protein
MKRHELDLTSLIAGLLFVAIAVAYVVGEYTDVSVDGKWVLPAALVGLGIAGLVGGVARTRRSPVDVADEEPTEETSPPNVDNL